MARSVSLILRRKGAGKAARAATSHRDHMPRAARRSNSRANVTISDVARQAGVSPATVSRVLNGGYPVAKLTRLHVEKAVHDLGHVRKPHAQGLRRAPNGRGRRILPD